MVDLGLTAFVLGLLALGLRRPFLWVLAYLYVDILAPQKISWFLLASIPISLIVFCLAFGGWLLIDDKRDSRFTLRQALLFLLLCYCGLTTLSADFPVEAAEKWSWVWKALVFAIFLPLTLRTRLRFEAAIMVMVLTLGAIVISGSIKTLGSGGGYGTLKLFVNDNTGLYEGSIISCVSIAAIPLVWWLARHTTVFPRNWMVRLFAVALTFACLLIPIGTQARTGLLCIVLLFLLSLRTVKHRFLYLAAMGTLALMAIPFLPESYTKRMDTIENHQADESASTRVAVWKWTLDYVKDNPFGGGFEAYRSNRLRIETRAATTDGNTTAVEVQQVEDAGRAYHSSYFEMLGEQGWPGLLLWLWIQALGIWQMERIRSRWLKKAAAPGAGPEVQWQAPLANALQQAHLVYMLGSLFVGIAFQAFILMLIGIQCGLWSYLKRIDSPQKRVIRGPRKLNIPNAVAAS
ncbi:putative O-glycosylation ligase, exosortase A system-associated [Novosphingobium sp. TH158]|uniref:putative O-glycosylation ligase, exosortase A system-associated n=1 Tax=Novosphingobium sp. TH158 TaxID=2067455 RepID=UPI000C7BEE59|nr:putative O-glycosylation ligase, exosortase A system-associated [Novosphingobium sp. TH158]PLK27367.1 putative O-glycosylation ligase, exosortase A system-associated [Novosphingobium sp. TH158]